MVIVSGGDAVSPFTTPTKACGSGLAAGNTDTALRAFLLDRGHAVYTAPAMNARGPVVEQDGFGAFGRCSIVLPEIMTINSTGDIDLAGVRLARFWAYLRTEYGITDLHVVGHSMGGLFSRAAIREIMLIGAPIRIRSLTTIGTPWQGSFLARYVAGEIDRSECRGDEVCEQFLDAFEERTGQVQIGAAQEVTSRHLMGENGWNEFQAGVLDDIPVTLIGGTYFDTVDGSPDVWPHDGIVSISSALATDVSESVLPHRTCVTFPDTHSIFVSDGVGAAWTTGLTWDPAAHAAVSDALARADTAT